MPVRRNVSRYSGPSSAIDYREDEDDIFHSAVVDDYSQEDVQGSSSSSSSSSSQGPVEREEWAGNPYRFVDASRAQNDYSEPSTALGAESSRGSGSQPRDAQMRGLPLAGARFASQMSGGRAPDRLEVEAHTQSEAASARRKKNPYMITEWNPVEWQKDKLARKQLYLSWQATLAGFSEPESVGRGEICDHRTFHLGGESFQKVFKVEEYAETSYYSGYMVGMHAARQKTGRISILTVDVRSRCSTLPFDVGILCSEPEYNQVTVPGHGNFMAVVGACSQSDAITENIVDMRRSLSTTKMIMVMLIDMEELTKSRNFADRGMTRCGEILSGSSLHKIVTVLYDDKSDVDDGAEGMKDYARKLYSQMTIEKNKIMSSGKTWFSNLDVESVEKIVDYMIALSKKSPKVNSLTFTLVPLGEAKWTDPLTWPFKHKMYVGLSPNDINSSSMASSSSASKMSGPVFTQNIHAVSIDLSIRFI
jgi:hypothetical protein